MKTYLVFSNVELTTLFPFRSCIHSSSGRQLVSHGHITVNGKRLDIPSALIKVGDVIGVKEKSRGTALFKEIAESKNALNVPAWLTADIQNLSGSVTRFPNRDEIDIPVDEQAIVELYSR